MLRLREAFRLPQLPHEEDADEARSGLDRDADLQPGVSASLHVGFPFGIAGKAGFTVAGITGRGGPPLASASDGEALQQLSIESDIELLWPAHAHDVVLILPAQANLDAIFAVDWKVMANRDAATGSERQVFALPVVLQHVQWNRVRREPRTCGRQTGREPRDLTGHRQISLQVGRRNREDIREVVEAAVRRVIPGEQRLHIELEREQVANRVVVFRAIETVDGARLAWIRIGRPRAIDFHLHPARHGVIGGHIGPRPPGRRHRAGPKLRDHALPGVGVAGRVADIQTVEGKPAGTKFLVMARDAVLVEDRVQ